MIQEHLAKVRSTIPDNVQLIAVSKTKLSSDILEVYQAGQKIFGENKALEMAQKHEELPKDIFWHFIGHLQTNKVKYIAPFVTLIHSVDSLKLLKEINHEAIKNNRTIDCLLEFYIASEETKFGLSIEEAKEILDSKEFESFKNIRVCGVMGMASFTDDKIKIHNEFRQLKNNFDELKKMYFLNNESFKEISMGMSNDYPIAIEEGATFVRVGSLIFGERNHTSK